MGIVQAVRRLAPLGARWGLAALCIGTPASPAASSPRTNGCVYNAIRLPRVPCTMHVVRIPRRDYQMRSMHAGGLATGLATVTDQARLLERSGIRAVAAINGDFYQRGGPYGGDPRGLQIVEEELISAPSGSPSFWIDAGGEPHIGETQSGLRVAWPGGASSEIGLNGYRQADRIQLYTPAVGSSTRTTGGREFILESTTTPSNSWLPLRPGRIYRARVSDVRSGGNSPIPPDGMVLSVGPRLNVSLQIGDEIGITTATQPVLRGAKAAISGGPVLVRNGRAVRIRVPDSEAYEFSTMTERHPRSAMGWNDDYFYFVAVDGRQRGVSSGLTLAELAAKLVELGCREALNLDGGGSSTLWYEGRVRNFLCDGYERETANCLVATEPGGNAAAILAPGGSPVAQP